MQSKFWFIEECSLEIPKIYTFLACCGGFLILSLLSWLCCGTLSSNFECQGYLSLDPALVSVHSKTEGLVQKVFVKNGQEVNRGALLLSINNSKLLDLAKNVKFKIKMQRLALLQKNIILKKKQLNALKKLTKNGYLSNSSYQAASDSLRLLKNTKEDLYLSLLRMQEQKSYKIYAPIKGKVEYVNLKIGSFISEKEVLLNIIPAASNLEAVFCVPTSKYNFLQIDQEILLKIDAYPYRNFGTLAAHVSQFEVNDVVDLPFIHEKSCYKAKAKLAKDFKHLILKPGMTFSTKLTNKPIAIWRKWFLYGVEKNVF